MNCGVGGTSWVGNRWCGGASGWRGSQGKADHVEVPESSGLCAVDSALGGGKRGSTAVVSEISDGEKRAGDEIRAILGGTCQA